MQNQLICSSSEYLYLKAGQYFWNHTGNIPPFPGQFSLLTYRNNHLNKANFTVFSLLRIFLFTNFSTPSAWRSRPFTNRYSEVKLSELAADNFYSSDFDLEVRGTVSSLNSGYVCHGTCTDKIFTLTCVSDSQMVSLLEELQLRNFKFFYSHPSDSFLALVYWYKWRLYETHQLFMNYACLQLHTRNATNIWVYIRQIKCKKNP